MGFPVVTVKTDFVKKTMEISQERYLSVDPDFVVREDHDYQWWVPISFDFVGGEFNKTYNDYWLKPGQKSLVIDLPQVSASTITCLHQWVKVKIVQKFRLFKYSHSLSEVNFYSNFCHIELKL